MSIDKWINDSDRWDSGTDSNYKLENTFFNVIVRETSLEVKSGKASPGDWMLIKNTKWTQATPIFVIGPRHQEFELYPSRDEAIEAGEKWFSEQTDKAESAIRGEIESLKTTAQEKGFKAGWVWYRVKDKFGIDIANKYLPKQ